VTIFAREVLRLRRHHGSWGDHDETPVCGFVRGRARHLFVDCCLVSPSRATALVPSALTVLRASTSPPAPAHSVALGPLSPSVELHIDVTLRLPDPSAVTAFITSVSDRRSADFHHFLRPGQFGQLFGPPPSEVTAVDAVLRSDGLHPGQLTSNRLSIPVTAPASALDRAFHVSLASYRLSSGRAAFTTPSPPSISAAVAPDIQGVIGPERSRSTPEPACSFTCRTIRPSFFRRSSSDDDRSDTMRASHQRSQQ